MKQEARLGTRMHGLYRMPGNPFEAVDVDGRPRLPMTIDDDAPSNGTPPGPFVDIDPDTGRSLMSNVLLAEALHWTIE